MQSESVQPSSAEAAQAALEEAQTSLEIMKVMRRYSLHPHIVREMIADQRKLITLARAELRKTKRS